jgi:hypothetical protein
MRNEAISSEEFRREVLEAAGSLSSYGFRRAPQFDSETPTTASVVYVGQNIAFEFTFDLRDQAIDLVVTRYRDGKLSAFGDGGYSSSLFIHLLNRCGFRGRPTPGATLPPTASKAQRQLASLLNLLAQPCSANLLADRADALPQ